MEEQTQNSVNEIPSRWRRFSAYLLDLLINLTIIFIIPLLIYFFIAIKLGPITIKNFSPMTTRHIIIIAIIMVLVILEIIIIANKHTSPGYKLIGIITSNNNNGIINRPQSILRHFIFNPTFLPIILFLIRLIIYLTVNTIHCHGGIYDMNNDIYIALTQDPVCKIGGTLRDIANGIGIIGLILLFISIIEIFFKCPTFIDKLLGVKRFYNKSNKTGTEINK